jgi:hypothetical protein
VSGIARIIPTGPSTYAQNSNATNPTQGEIPNEHPMSRGSSTFENVTLMAMMHGVVNAECGASGAANALPPL